MESGDRENLVLLFSSRFAERICYGRTESGLVVCGKKLKDPILVLGEAYAKSHDPTIHKRIATALHHSFDGVGVKGKDEGEFVKNAMKWFQDNKETAVFNPYHDGGGGVLDWDASPLYFSGPEEPAEKKWKRERCHQRCHVNGRQ